MSDAWMQTIFNRKWDLLDPAATPVDWEEIAHALSGIPRFTNHTRTPYSVAQHCCLVADFLPEPYKLAGLLHDAHEAYTGDVSTPMQRALGAAVSDAIDRIADLHWVSRATREAVFKNALRTIQGRHDEHIMSAAGIWPLSPECVAAVKTADIVLLNTEKRDLLGPPPAPWAAEYDRYEPLPERIEVWTASKAYTRWLTRLRALGVRT